MAKKKHIVVPLKRVVKYKTTGPDARAVKRALRRLGFTKGKKITPVFGAYSVRALKKAQRKFGIPADGVYGPRTHRAFLRHNAYDPFGALLMSSVKLKKTPATEDVRSRMVAICMYCYAHRDRMNYLQRQDRGVRAASGGAGGAGRLDRAAAPPGDVDLHGATDGVGRGPHPGGAGGRIQQASQVAGRTDGQGSV
jgi:hypothetical protein